MKRLKRPNRTWNIKGDLPLGLLLLGGSFLLGGLLGCFLASLLEEGDSLSAYFTAYFTLIHQIDWSPNLTNCLWSNLKIPLLAFLLGFSFLGVIALPILFATEGFLFAFSISALCRLLGTAGLLPSFFLFALPALIGIPVLFVLGEQSLRSAFLLIGQGRKISGEIYPNGFFLRGLCCVLALILSISLEYFIIPVLLKATILPVG